MINKEELLLKLNKELNLFIGQHKDDIRYGNQNIPERPDLLPIVNAGKCLGFIQGMLTAIDLVNKDCETHEDLIVMSAELTAKIKKLDELMTAVVQENA